MSNEYSAVDESVLWSNCLTCGAEIIVDLGVPRARRLQNPDRSLHDSTCDAAACVMADVENYAYRRPRRLQRSDGSR
jgi:uncharacterized protein YaeQ